MMDDGRGTMDEGPEKRGGSEERSNIHRPSSIVHHPSSIACPLTHAARTHASRPSVIWGARRITYLQLNQFVNTTVKALKERNLKAGSYVALISDNSVESVIILL